MNRNTIILTLAIVGGVIGGMLLTPLLRSAGQSTGLPLSLLFNGAILIGVVAFVIYSLASNKRGVKADPMTRDQALRFQPIPGRTRLYLLREGFVGKAQGIDIELDGIRVAQLKSPRFTCIELAPGRHVLTAQFASRRGKARGEGRLELEAREGELLLCRIGVAVGAWSGTVELRQEPNPVALQATLARTMMVLPLEPAAR